MTTTIARRTRPASGARRHRPIAPPRPSLIPGVAVRRLGDRLIIADGGERRMSLSVEDAAALIRKLLREAPELGGQPCRQRVRIASSAEPSS